MACAGQQFRSTTFLPVAAADRIGLAGWRHRCRSLLNSQHLAFSDVLDLTWTNASDMCRSMDGTSAGTLKRRAVQLRIDGSCDADHGHAVSVGPSARRHQASPDRPSRKYGPASLSLILVSALVGIDDRANGVGLVLLAFHEGLRQQVPALSGCETEPCLEQVAQSREQGPKIGPHQ